MIHYETSLIFRYMKVKFFLADGEYSLATLCLRGNRDDYTALCLCNLLVVEPRSVRSCPDTYITKNKTPVWVFNFLWRMGRDSNPRKPCDFSGFQDRRIRPLCHPS